MGRGADASAAIQPSTAKKLSWKEVAKHNTLDDAWVVVNGKVIDVSGWKAHPGGRVVFSLAGKDATDAFRGFHQSSTWELLNDRQIGVVDMPELTPFGKDIRRLRIEFKKRGWFEASPLYYAYKTAELLSITALGVAILNMFPRNWWATLAAMTLFAVAWQQAGWLSHDYLHHQVFEQRWLGDLMGLFLGNFIQGFSIDWWKNKHNTHHAIPNLHESEDDKHDGDPDIDTLPFLAWSPSMAGKAQKDETGWTQFFVRNQQLLFFPLLSFARLTWAQQSIAYAVAPLMPSTAAGGAWGGGRVNRSLRHPVAEVVGLALHYAAIGLVCYLYMTPLQSVVFFLGAQMICGILLAVSFVVGHNGMECFDQDDHPSFAELQVRTTRNVTNDALGFSGWFTGGLHLQVEHHLFPTMPRHNLAKAQPFIMEACRKHGVRYHTQPLLTGVWEVLACLDETAEPLIAAIRDFPAV